MKPIPKMLAEEDFDVLGKAPGGECYSLRASLFNAGVYSEEEMRKHLAFVYNTSLANRNIDIRRYTPETISNMG